MTALRAAPRKRQIKPIPETCPKCNGSNLVVLFGQRARWRCKDCANKYAREYNKAHPEVKAARLQRDPSAFRKHRIKARYGITLAEYDELLKRQAGACAICHKPETKRMGGRILPLSIDHCHTTQKVRGLLCHRCNIALGYIEDQAWLRAAEVYLGRRDR